MVELARRMDELETSSTLTANARARELIAAGIRIINLSIGALDLPTPASIQEAGCRAITGGGTRYTPSRGPEELRDAIREKFSTQNGIEYTDDEIMVVPGAKYALYLGLLATCDPGSEVLIPVPYYPSYAQQVRLAGGMPRYVHPQGSSGKISAEDLAGAITENTRWLILNSPSNPAGTTYSQHELEVLADVVRAHPNVMVMTDEIYENFVFDGAAHVSFAAAAPDLRERVLTVNGMSKTDSMTGWRVGYAGGSADLIAAMSTLQGETLTCASSVSQWAAIAALHRSEEERLVERALIAGRRDALVAGLKTIPDLHVPCPAGSFYVFTDFHPYLNRVTPQGKTLESDADLTEYLVSQAHVSSVPGSAFGAPGFLRMSLSVPEKDLTQAATQVATALAALA